MTPNQPTILIVEDDMLLALDAADDISSTGAQVRTASSVSEALQILDNEAISGAILDFDVLDGTIGPVARRLDASGIPYRIVSGTSKETVALAGLNTSLLRPKPARYKTVYLSMNARRSLPPNGLPSTDTSSCDRN